MTFIKRTISLASVLSLSVGVCLLVGACTEVEEDGNKDIWSPGEAGYDAGVDLHRDAPQVGEAGGDGPLAAETGADVFPWQDVLPGVEAGGDGPQLEAGPQPEAGGDGTTLSNAKCSSPQTLTLVSGTVTVTGDTTGATNEFGTSIKCGTSFDFDGEQLYYKVALTGGKTYKVTATPTTSWDVAVYAFTDTTCTAATIDTQCTSWASDSGGSGKAESFMISPTASTTYIIAVDSFSTTASGAFTLTVSEFTPAANSTCANAQTLTLSGTPATATVTGDTTGVNDEYAGAVNCGYSSAFDGPQVYYKVAMTANQAYKIDIKPTFYSYIYVFKATSCGTATSINTDCGSSGSTGDYLYVSSSSTTTAFYFTPTTAGDYIIAVDSTGTTSTYFGTFTLTVSEFTPAANSTCANAQTLTLSGTPATATVTGDTTGVADEYASAVNCGYSSAFDGPQVYYKVTMTANQAYKIHLAPTPTYYSYLYVFKATSCGTATSINTDCGSGGSTGDYLYVSSSTSGGGYFFFTPTTAGDYIIAIDSTGTTSSYFGTFTLTVSEFTPAANSTCATAQTLTLSGTPATGTVSGDTAGVNDEYATVYCGKTSALDGPQVYYKVNLTAAKTYYIKVTPSFTAYAYIFRSASCSSATAVDADCASVGATGDVMGSISSGSTGAIYFTPTTGGDYIIAVDSTGTTSSYFGTFSLTVTEYVVPSFTAPVSWDFESSCQGLAATGDWECGQIAFSAGTNCETYTPTPPTAGSSGTGKGMYGTKLSDCYSPLGNNTGSSSTSCSNTTPSDDSILSFKVTIPSTWTTATMTFYDWQDVNGYFDWMEIRINNTSVKAWCNPTGKPTAWVQQTVSLSSYVGQTITIAFHFLASTVVQYAGWYIDDLVISGS